MKNIIDSLKEGVTQSELVTWDTCAFKWFMRYVLKAGMPTLNWNFLQGNAWDDTLNGIYNILKEGNIPGPDNLKVAKLQIPRGIAKTSEDDLLIEHWNNIIRVYAEEYMQFYDCDQQLDVEGIQQEYDITFPYRDVKIRGRGIADLVYKWDKKRFIVDHKFLSGLDKASVDGWEFKLQCLWYLWLDRLAKEGGKRCNGFTYNVAIKPSIRLKQSETTSAFYHRVRKEIKAEPAKFFKRITVPVTDETLDRFEKEVLKPKLDRIAILLWRMQMQIQPAKLNQPDFIVDALCLNKTETACHSYGHVCEFFEVCRVGFEEKKNELEFRKSKHEEIARLQTK